MFVRNATLLALLVGSASAFTAHLSQPTSGLTTRLYAESQQSVESAIDEIRQKISYKPGGADTEFARRFGHLKGAEIKTVGEAFADFTRELGSTVNPLYKNMVTDMVGTTHLTLVNARFKRDAVWSLGILTALDLLLKNYPDKKTGTKIVSALFSSLGLDEAEIRAEAKTIGVWSSSASREEVEAALSGEGSSPLATIAKEAKADEFWMYSRYFGIGILKVMENVGIDMDKDEVYPIMEDWMSNKFGQSHLTACADSDLFFKVRSKLDMMETMMKEIEIREKKRMAERLENKAEEALRAAEREEKMQAEIAAEAKESRERVASDS